MPKYDRQLILRFMNGSKHDIDTRVVADALNRKAIANSLKSHRFTVPTVYASVGVAEKIKANVHRWAELKRVLPMLTRQSRLYLVGHGDWRSQTLGELGPSITASMLAQNLPNGVGVISIVACGLGADSDASNTVRVSHSINSFAGTFHGELGRLKCYTQVYARIWNVVLDDPEDDDPNVGRKSVQRVGWREQHRMPNSKFRFFWNGDQQMREFVY